ncbi:MAG: DUF1705 domain-containing protein, partial [Muribaculaceae bacterium]|nr:DUF1705 domain-containing protein [Muribaculaceae bacterium]
MKRSENRHNYYRHILPGILLWLIPLALIVPNIALDITEMRYSDLSRCINLLIPAGAYLGICASLRRVGLSGLFAIPMMVLCAFQIVLLFLYGESIIAVDMFLNVLTTNSREAGELLANLVPAIVCVLAVYL